jgi:hypothetical protein
LLTLQFCWELPGYLVVSPSARVISVPLTQTMMLPLLEADWWR